MPTKQSELMSGMHRTARWYAQKGMAVFPCHWLLKGGACSCGKADCNSPGKHPRSLRGFQDATTDLERIDAWWIPCPQANIGICTGKVTGLLVLDLDPRNGGPSDRSEIVERLGPLPDTAEVMTGGGGRHIYFRYTGGKVPPNLEPGVDLKGDGGYVIAPPSRHKSGKQYTWDGLAGMKALLNPAPVPIWLLQRIEAKLKTDVTTRTNGNGNHAVSEQIPEGERNTHLTSLAGSMRSRGMSPEAITAGLLEENRRFVKPLPEAEVRAIAKSVARYLPNNNRVNGVYSVGAAHTEPPTNGVNGVYSVAGTATEWPAPLGSAAHYGLAGEFLKLVEPHSEADPAALLLQFLTAFGNCSGRGNHFKVESSLHHLNLFTCIVGATSKARKGTSFDRAIAPFSVADPTWAQDRVKSGLSSGEGLIELVADGIETQQPVKEKGRTVRFETITSPGVDDKRLLIVESEFARTLQACQRDTNTLSAVIRQAWDTGHLDNLTRKQNKIRATGAHISLIAHITKDELRRMLTDTAMVNGFANRFLWCCARRSRVLPEGGDLNQQDIDKLGKKVLEAVQFANKKTRTITRSDKSRALWATMYETLSAGKPGLFGAVTSRAEAQVMRLACIYCLLNKQEQILGQHLSAALAVWKYCEDSARFIFGDSLGDPLADDIWQALRSSAAGLTRNEIREYYNRNKSSEEISRALNVLAEYGRAQMKKDLASGQGRPVERWVAIHA